MKYTKDHEWLRIEGEEVCIGITIYAAEALGDVVFVELPEVGTDVEKDDEVVVIESVKAASDIHAPIAGTITSINEELVDNPSIINEDPIKLGWFFKIKPNDISDIDEFMDEDAYKQLIASA